MGVFCCESREFYHFWLPNNYCTIYYHHNDAYSSCDFDNNIYSNTYYCKNESNKLTYNVLVLEHFDQGAFWIWSILVLGRFDTKLNWCTVICPKQHRASEDEMTAGYWYWHISQWW